MGETLKALAVFTTYKGPAEVPYSKARALAILLGFLLDHGF